MAPGNEAEIVALRPQDGIDKSVRFYTIHGYRRAVRMAGDGEVVVLVHGFAENALSWRSVFAKLAAKYRVIAPDLLGHGLSDKPRADYSVAGYANGLRDLLTVLGVERATVVGHSLGGAVAAQFAYQFPERVDRLVVVSGGGFGADVHPMLRLMSAPVGGEWMRLLWVPGVQHLARPAAGVLRAVRKQTGLGPAVLGDLPQIVACLSGLRDPKAYRAALQIIRNSVDWRGQAASALDRCYLNEQLPVQIVWGSKDVVVPARHAHNAHAAMPGSRLEIFDGSGHFPYDDDPDRFVRVLSTFMDSTQPRVFDADRWRTTLAAGAPQATGAAAMYAT